MPVRILVVVLLGFLSYSMPVMAQDPGFPGRAKYPEVPIYSQTDLLQRLEQVVVVDARSSLEFDTLRIKGAINIPVASKQFEEQMKALRNSTSKPIVCYCNGRTCMKSYIAVKKAKAAGVTNIYAYDAGMFDWVEAYPHQSELLGKSPVNPRAIISLKAFHQHLLSPDDFSNKAYQLGRQGQVLDVRDKYQRGATGLFPGMEQWISLDKNQEISAAIARAKRENKTLLIYDEVGHQVQWLQYTLERDNMPNYFFMAKGARAYYAKMMQEFGMKPVKM